MTHPYVLHATTAVHSLRRAAGYLTDARDAILITRPQLGPAATRPRTLAQLQAHDRLLRAERADRLRNLRDGIKAAGAMPAPIDPGLLDLERDLNAGVHHVTLLVASALYRHPLHGHAGRGARSGGVWDYLAAAVPLLRPRQAREVHGELQHLDWRLRTLIGLDPDLWPLPGAPACPACGLRTLAAQTSAADSAAWTVTCDSDACTCAGRTCPCGMTSRPPGTRHIWPADACHVQTTPTTDGGLTFIGISPPAEAAPAVPDTQPARGTCSCRTSPSRSPRSAP